MTTAPGWIDDLSRDHIKKLFEHGMIGLTDNQEKLSKPMKEDYPEHQRFKEFQGIPIHISEAARIYQVSESTLISYVKKGFIEVLGKDKNRKLLDRQDVAYCSFILKEYGGRGKKAFNDDGTPNYQ